MWVSRTEHQAVERMVCTVDCWALSPPLQYSCLYKNVKVYMHIDSYVYIYLYIEICWFETKSTISIESPMKSAIWLLIRRFVLLYIAYYFLIQIVTTFNIQWKYPQIFYKGSEYKITTTERNRGFKFSHYVVLSIYQRFHHAYLQDLHHLSDKMHV